MRFIVMLALLASSIAASAQHAPTPVAGWNLNGNAGGIYPDFRGPHGGTREGAISDVANANLAGWTTVSFDGAGAIRIPNNSSSLNPSAVTVSAVIRPRNFSSVQQIFSKDKTVGPSRGRSWQFRLDAGGKVRFIVFGQHGYSSVAGGGVRLNEWNHVAASWDGRTQRVYVNGEQVASRQFLDSFRPGQPNDLLIGRSENVNPRYFRGEITRVELFNRALSAQKISTMQRLNFVPWGYDQIQIYGCPDGSVEFLEALTLPPTYVAGQEKCQARVAVMSDCDPAIEVQPSYEFCPGFLRAP